MFDLAVILFALSLMTGIYKLPETVEQNEYSEAGDAKSTCTRLKKLYPQLNCIE